MEVGSTTVVGASLDEVVVHASTNTSYPPTLAGAPACPASGARCMLDPPTCRMIRASAARAPRWFWGNKREGKDVVDSGYTWKVGNAGGRAP